MDSGKLITKSLVQSHRQCPRRAWLEASGTVEAQFDMGTNAMLEQGAHVHAAGRSLFPGLRSVAGTLDMADAEQQTAELMADVSVPAIAEAAFVVDGIGVRVDVLHRLDEGGFGIVEIKSGSSVKPDYVDDVAIQYAVAMAVGVDVRRVEIMHPSTQVERPAGGTGAEVLVREAVTDAADERRTVVAGWVSRCAATVTGAEPKIAPGLQCKTPHNCPFAHHCGEAGEQIDPDSIALLPSKSGKTLRTLIAAGHRRISTLPREAIEHPGNLMMYMALRLDGTVVSDRFSKFLRELPYPRRFLDFEAASFALPRFDGMRGHQSVVFQWSCHLQERSDAAPLHTEFLDVSGNDPREPFARSLLAAVGEDGPVFVYSSYEKSRLKELTIALPHLKDQIMALVARLVDLLPMARKGFYNPAMNGSWSIKKIEPVLPRGNGRKSYAELEEVAEGTAAQAAYMDQTNPTVVGQQKEIQKARMLEYCQLDTQVLVDFVEYVQSVGRVAQPSVVTVEVEPDQETIE